MTKAIFIDRDGVINSDVGHYYIYRKEDFVLNDGILEALKQFQDAGYLLIVITNQGGINKGEYSINDVEEVHQKLRNLLSAADIQLTDIYYCPHHDTLQTCLCRKPLNLNIEKAIARFDIDRSLSCWYILSICPTISIPPSSIIATDWSTKSLTKSFISPPYI